MPRICGTPTFDTGLFDRHGPNAGKNLALRQVAVGHHQTVAMLIPKVRAFGNPLRRTRLYRSGRNLIGALSDNLGQGIAGQAIWQFYVFGSRWPSGLLMVAYP